MPRHVPMGDPRPYNLHDYANDIVNVSSMHVSASPTFPGIAQSDAPKKYEPPCVNATWGHQWHDEVVEERKPIYSLGSFCRFVKIKRACGCGVVKFVARLYLGDIFITGDWPEDVQ